MEQVLRSFRHTGRHAPATVLRNHVFQNSFHFNRILVPVFAGNDNADLGSSVEPLKVLRVSGDGNCLFRSLAQSYTAVTSGSLLNEGAETEMAVTLRQQICDELLSQRDSVEPFLADCDFETYILMMRRDGCWGGEPELSVAPTVLQRSVEVYMPQGQAYGISKIADYIYSDCSVSMKTKDKGKVRVLFSGAGHYDALIQIRS